MKRIVRVFLALAALVWLAGCLDFLSEEVYLARSKDGKDMYCLLVYHGIYARDDYKESLGQFEGFLSHEDEFCVGDNWITHVSLAETSDTLTEKMARDKPEEYAWKKYLVQHIEIRHGALYREKESGRLGGYQVLCLRGVDEFVNLANRALGEAIAEDSTTSPSFPLTYQLWKNLAARKSLRILECKNSTLGAVFPAPANEMSAIRKHFAREATKGIQDERSTETLRIMVDFLAENPISFVQTRDQFRFTAGYSDEPVNRLSFFRENKYSGNLMQFASRQSLWKLERSPSDFIEKFKRNPEDFFLFHQPATTQAASKPAPKK